MEELDQLQSGWVILIALKDLLSIVKKEPDISFIDAIKFVYQIEPDILKESNILLGEKKRLKEIYNKFLKETLDDTNKIKRGASVKHRIANRISEIRAQLEQFVRSIDLEKPPIDEMPLESVQENGLRKELSDLNALLNIGKKQILNLQGVTESQAISNDAFLNRSNKIWIQSQLGKFNTYIDKKNNAIFRVAILHPNPSEAITGADLIYEQYNSQNEMVRIAAIQYKIWENGTLYFSKHKNLEKQLNNMQNCFCKNNFCKSVMHGNEPKKFQRPYCCAFLRPTNKLQPDSARLTTGYHLPVCRIQGVMTEGSKKYMLEFFKIRNESIETEIFEELFNNEVLGSNWMDKADLEDFYRMTKILEPSQKIILYAQNIRF